MRWRKRETWAERQRRIRIESQPPPPAIRPMIQERADQFRGFIINDAEARMLHDMVSFMHRDRVSSGAMR